MSDAEFDRHAASYRQQHEQTIAIAGEVPAYFAEYKMRDFRALVDEVGLPVDGRYLDFGSGVGASVGPFCRHMPGARLVCADVSADSLSLSAAACGDAIEHVWMPEGVLPFADGEFDGAFACCVFHHIPHDKHTQAMSEIKRVLKPGGLLMIYEHNPFNPLTVRTVRNCPFDENAVLLTARQLQHGLNRRFTFASDRPHGQALPRFAIAMMSCFALNLAVLKVGMSVLALPVALAQALAMASFTVSFYLASRFLVFRA